MLSYVWLLRYTKRFFNFVNQKLVYVTNRFQKDERWQIHLAWRLVEIAYLIRKKYMLQTYTELSLEHNSGQFKQKRHLKVFILPYNTIPPYFVRVVAFGSFFSNLTNFEC